MPTNLIDHARAEYAISNQRGHREHVHRTAMEEVVPERRRSSLDLAFWPTCRDPDLVQPLIANFNCQRCGDNIPPACGWWCNRCRPVAAWLQCVKGLSMRSIAGSGEWDPPAGWWWISRHAPWLLPESQNSVTDIHWGSAVRRVFSESGKVKRR